MEDIGRAVIRMEVAQDVLGAIITHYAGVLGKERAKPEPDQAVIDKALEAQDAMEELRDSLDFRDRDRVEGIIKKYGPIARELWGL